ncbi:hypothetical protein EV356DRAFT_210893 [Viridothelium virens]|uniref:Uncharacterized protein n=1 Tax=Viridothelium virens TaxID=1048519 RepID=A0A6A6H5U0_VIRVR|nr:hypothetical protein EV356DRAFT_210893 [Viridothelium virens]
MMEYHDVEMGLHPRKSTTHSDKLDAHQSTITTTGTKNPPEITEYRTRSMPMPTRRSSSYIKKELSEVSCDLQKANPAIFIPKFTHLRRVCLWSIWHQLQKIESNLKSLDPSSQRYADLILIASGLLKRLGTFAFCPNEIEVAVSFNISSKTKRRRMK